MRTIRFRGMPFEDVDFDEIDVHIKDYEFVYGNLIVDGDKAFIVNGIVECSEDNLQLEQWIRVRPETVGQFIEFKDANGIEIFEGDIVADEDDLPYAKSLTREELIEKTKVNHPEFLVVKYGLEEVDAFYGMAYNVWSFLGNDNGERLARENVVIGNIHNINKGE